MNLVLSEGVVPTVLTRILGSHHTVLLRGPSFVRRVPGVGVVPIAKESSPLRSCPGVKSALMSLVEHVRAILNGKHALVIAAGITVPVLHHA